MANSEDYLDGLLNSVQTVRKDVAQAEAEAEENRKQREEERNRIKPDDDFMEVSGLSEYVFEPTSHEHLKKAFSEEDFLRNFEDELELDDLTADEFIQAFEKEIEQDEERYQTLEMEQELTGDSNSTFMDNVQGVVNQAKEQIDNGQIPKDLPDLPDEEELSLESAFEEARNYSEQQERVAQTESEVQSDETGENKEVFVEGDMPILMEEKSDDVGDETEEVELSQEPDEVEEDGIDLRTLDSLLPEEDTVESQIGEESEDVDLMELLSGDTDLDDISALLSADEQGETLDETQEGYEKIAEETVETVSLQEEEKAVKNAAGISLVEKIKTFFGRKKQIEEGVLDIATEQTEDLTQENLDIIQSMEEDEQAQISEEAKKQAKKEAREAKKKEKQEKKEAKEKKPKKEKVKKEKQPDYSPKIPGKVIAVFLVLGCSIVVLVTIGQSLLGYRTALSQSRSAYGRGDYFTAYEKLVGVDLKEDDEILFMRARLLGDLQKRNQEYHVFVSKEMYALALDSLIIGVARYDEYQEEAKSLDIENELLALGEPLIQTLSDQFGVSKEEAIALYKMNREDYSVNLDNILKEVKLN